MSNRGVGALADLKWKLQIFGLHNVTSYESATRTNLWRKSGIEHLGLFWSGTEKEHHANYVLEGLKPHWKKSENFKNSGLSNLSFPSLMGKEKFSLQFGNWIEIKLDRLNECKQLPSLGNLPCLQILHIFGLYKVICIGKGFQLSKFDSVRWGFQLSGRSSVYTVCEGLYSSSVRVCMQWNMKGWTLRPQSGWTLSHYVEQKAMQQRCIQQENFPRIAHIPEFDVVT